MNELTRKTNNQGFTLIELMIVMVLIAVLSALAIPQMGATRDQAIVASMKNDLRNLAAAQEGYFTNNFTYAADLSAVLGSIRGSENVALTIDSASTTGWGATASHPAVVEVCRMAVGSSRTVSPYCELP